MDLNQSTKDPPHAQRNEERGVRKESQATEASDASWRRPNVYERSTARSAAGTALALANEEQSLRDSLWCPLPTENKNAPRKATWTEWLRGHPEAWRARNGDCNSQESTKHSVHGRPKSVVQRPQGTAKYSSRKARPKTQESVLVNTYIHPGNWWVGTSCVEYEGSTGQQPSGESSGRSLRRRNLQPSDNSFTNTPWITTRLEHHWPRSRLPVHRWVRLFPLFVPFLIFAGVHDWQVHHSHLHSCLQNDWQLVSLSAFLRLLQGWCSGLWCPHHWVGPQLSRVSSHPFQGSAQLSYPSSFCACPGFLPWEIWLLFLVVGGCSQEMGTGMSATFQENKTLIRAALGQRTERDDFHFLDRWQ